MLNVICNFFLFCKFHQPRQTSESAEFDDDARAFAVAAVEVVNVVVVVVVVVVDVVTVVVCVVVVVVSVVVVGVVVVAADVAVGGETDGAVNWKMNIII